jgi:hypothetical protein
MTNVTRGLFRLWIVVSVLWVIGAGSVVWWDYRASNAVLSQKCADPDWAFNPRTKECFPTFVRRLDEEPYDVDAYLREAREEVQRMAVQNLGYGALATLLPPIIVLIVGASLVWAIRGFRSHPPSTS